MVLSGKQVCYIHFVFQYPFNGMIAGFFKPQCPFAGIFNPFRGVAFCQTKYALGLLVSDFRVVILTDKPTYVIFGIRAYFFCSFFKIFRVPVVVVLVAAWHVFPNSCICPGLVTSLMKGDPFIAVEYFHGILVILYLHRKSYKAVWAAVIVLILTHVNMGCFLDSTPFIIPDTVYPLGQRLKESFFGIYKMTSAAAVSMTEQIIIVFHKPVRNSIIELGKTEKCMLLNGIKYALVHKGDGTFYKSLILRSVRPGRIQGASVKQTKISKSLVQDRGILRTLTYS